MFHETKVKGIKIDVVDGYIQADGVITTKVAGDMNVVQIEKKYSKSPQFRLDGQILNEDK